MTSLNFDIYLRSTPERAWVRIGLRHPPQDHPRPRRDLSRPLGDSRQAGLRAQGQHRRHLGRITRPNDGRRVPQETPRPVGGEPRGRVAGQHVCLAHAAS